MTVWLEIGGRKRRIDLPEPLAGGAFQCLVDGQPVSADFRILKPGVMSLVVNGHQYRCILDRDGDGSGVWIGGSRFEFTVDDPRSLQGRRGAGSGAEGPRAIKAPMPGRVVRVLVETGAEVAEGQGVIVIEAMKMQNELKSPKSGRIMRVAAAVGDTVGAADVLVVVE